MKFRETVRFGARNSRLPCGVIDLDDVPMRYAMLYYHSLDGVFAQVWTITSGSFVCLLQVILFICKALHIHCDSCYNF